MRDSTREMLEERERADEAEREASDLRARCKHVNRMADCVEQGLLAVLRGDTASAETWLKQAMKHFAEWEK